MQKFVIGSTTRCCSARQQMPRRSVATHPVRPKLAKSMVMPLTPSAVSLVSVVRGNALMDGTVPPKGASLIVREDIEGSAPAGMSGSCPACTCRDCVQNPGETRYWTFLLRQKGSVLIVPRLEAHNGICKGLAKRTGVGHTANTM